MYRRYIKAHTCEHSPHHSRSLEQTDPLTSLRPFIPASNNVLRSAVGGGLGNTLKEPDSSKLRIVCAAGTCYSQSCPDDGHEGEPYSGCDLLDD